MVEDRLAHSCLIEYEYEYRFTEYEYDLPDERLNSPGRGQVTWMTPCEFAGKDVAAGPINCSGRWIYRLYNVHLWRVHRRGA
jgi:hypothetical protein